MSRSLFAAAPAALMAPIMAIAASGGLIAGAHAQEPKSVATFKDWSVFVRDSDGDKLCFAASEAKDKSPKSVNHGEIFFLVASWKSGAAVEQPSLMTGYELAGKPEPTLRVGSDKWEMYSDQNEAFIEAKTEEQRLIGAMKRGADMRVSAVSHRGTATSYVVSLRGITAALDRVKRECS